MPQPAPSVFLSALVLAVKQVERAAAEQEKDRLHPLPPTMAGDEWEQREGGRGGKEREGWDRREQWE
eukprot:647185-Hanusia_phi.AAC.1